MDYAQYITEHLAASRARRKERSQELWRMTAAQRRAAMHAGELTWGQLCEWANKAPQEVPLINDEFAFIAAFTPEVADQDG